jgi:hypothetical protein
MNFGEVISETFRHRRWNYYSDEFIEKLNITTSDDCREFIRKFFAVSGKAGELNSIEEIKLLSNERCQHIVYVFLLGVGIYDKIAGIKTRIDEQIQQYVEQYGCKSDVTFYFIWFLCCLFHDLGYVEEESEKLVERIDFQIGQTLVGVPNVFSRRTIKNYWSFRQKTHGKNDHGIYAGITMFKSLCEIRSEQEKDSWKNEKLSWEKELEHIYNVASWIVLCHNIWFYHKGKKHEREIYEAYHLDKLLLEEGEYKIKMKEHPLFFFFCLIDTIEPIKRVKDYSLLEQIDVSFGEKEIIITSNLKCGCSDNYLNSVSNLNDWLIETHREDNRVTIELNLK